MSTKNQTGSTLQTLVLAATLATVLSGVQGTALAAPGAETITFAPNELNRCEAVRKRQASDELTRVYDLAFSKYVEICAASTWQMRGDKKGGNYGHAFAMIKGACVAKTKEQIAQAVELAKASQRAEAAERGAVLQDDNQVYESEPTLLVPCEKGVVGISSDYIFFNVQWLAAEGRNFALYGDHNPGVAFDKAAADRVKATAVAQGVFSNPQSNFMVQFEDSYENEEIPRKAKEAGASLEDYRAYWSGTASLGTDFAIAAARGGVDCTRIPMRGTKKGAENKPLSDLIAHLNKMNRQIYHQDTKLEIVAADGKKRLKGFGYDGAVNNCTSNFVNALASVGFWRMRDTSGHPSTMPELILRKGDISIPYNDMFDAYKIGSEFDLAGTVKKLRNNQNAFEYFKATGWLGAQAGVMIESVPAIEYMNSVYDTTNKTSFGSFLSEGQKKLIDWLKSPNSQFVISLVPAAVKEILRDWLGLDLQNLQPTEPSAMREFKRIRGNSSHRGTNLIANLEWWRDNIYTKYLADLNSGSFGNDEVVEELKTYFSKKSTEINRLLHFYRNDITPKQVPACSDNQ